ncbi:hypothetical protein SG34_032375 [Thalassomonas viridans]|uniref:Uncharacterized protein n=1 Tax=Thalassomonas viridans TaxID=137584 RepID=A0AAE9ZCF2_9GAMM|nr:hypothetical protein [Thalassomonas viridans]WDE08618.1 hypothetical protein SG34_032375 [Thalassomonas viridans]
MSDLLKKAAELGLIAAGRGLDKQASAISQGLKVLKPASAAPYIMDALLLLGKKQYQQALSALEKPAFNDEALDAFKIFILALQGKRQQAFSQIQESDSVEFKPFLTEIKDSLLSNTR